MDLLVSDSIHIMRISLKAIFESLFMKHGTILRLGTRRPNKRHQLKRSKTTSHKLMGTFQ